MTVTKMKAKSTQPLCTDKLVFTLLLVLRYWKNINIYYSIKLKELHETLEMFPQQVSDKPEQEGYHSSLANSTLAWNRLLNDKHPSEQLNWIMLQAKLYKGRRKYSLFLSNIKTSGINFSCLDLLSSVRGHYSLLRIGAMVKHDVTNRVLGQLQNISTFD